MKFDEIVQRLQQTFGAALREIRADTADPWVALDPSALVDVARFLRDSDGLAFDNLSILTATDFPPERIQLAYHLWSYPHHHLLVIKVDLPRSAPEVATVSAVWPAAAWYEREMFDLLGVKFMGHPTLRRLLLPEDWEGHPLRKDWQEPAQYQGMPTTRTFAIELQAEYAAELVKSRPLRGLLIYDGKETRRSGEMLAARLKLADVEVELIPVKHADPARARDCDLLVLGVYGKGLLSATAEGKTIDFIERLPDLGDKPCAVYEVYTGVAGDLLDRVAALVASKHGRVVGRGAVIAGRPDKDPDGLAATLLDAMRSGAIARPPAPLAPPAPAAAGPAQAPPDGEASHA